MFLSPRALGAGAEDTERGHANYFWLLKTEILTLRVHSYAPTTPLPGAPWEMCRLSAGSRWGFTGHDCVTLLDEPPDLSGPQFPVCRMGTLTWAAHQLPPAPPCSSFFFPGRRNSRAMRRWGQANPSHFIQEETQA